MVGRALKEVSANKTKRHNEQVEHEKDLISTRKEQAHRRELITRGGWHDGRIDDVCGNGLISELGLGQEPSFENDLESIIPLIDDIAPIHGEAVPPSAASMPPVPVKTEAKPISDADLDAEADFIKTLPIIVLQNFALKSARGDLWNVLSEWGASLIENRVAHVIVVTEGPTATKTLTKAMPTTPLNSVGLADADETNSLSYVQEKLVEHVGPLDNAQISKLGGRMVDLETLVYKVRNGSTIPGAVDDIILRNVVELRKQAFGDDAEDAKSLPWTRAQAWKVVTELAKHGVVRPNSIVGLKCSARMRNYCKTSPSRALNKV